MPGRLKSHINIWRRTTNDSFVLSVIQHGYRIQWHDSIPPPQSEQKNSKNCENHTEFITKSVEEALLLGVVQETSREHIHNVLPLNVNVKKNNGKLRLIFNAMFINQFMVVPTFKYPQLHKEGREIFGYSSWAYGIDISQAFYHIEIDPNYRKYLGFFWNGKYYTFVCMPFGTAFGPWLWDRILCPVIDSLKSNKLKIMAFCDDILGANSPKAQADEDGLRLKSFLILHGYIIQETKCNGIGNALPSIPGLGLVIDCQQQKYFLTDKREKQIISLCQDISSSSKIKARKLAQIAGIIISQIAALGPIARIRTRAMYNCLKTRLLQSERYSSSESYNQEITIDKNTREEARFWIRNIHRFNGQFISKIFSILAFYCKLASDASASGFGGFLQIPSDSMREKVNRVILNCKNKHFSVGTVTTDQLKQGIDVWGTFTPEQSQKSSSWRELYASAELLEIVGSLLSGCMVPLYLDSQVAVMALGGDIPQYPGKIFGGSKKEELQELVIRIFDITEQHNFGVLPIWIPREQNERADFNSHLNEYNHYDFSLKPEIFHQLDVMYGPHTIDRFASDDSTQLPHYNTKFYSKKASGLDAFMLNWGYNHNNYVFPPPALVGNVLQYAREYQAKITLVFLEWYSRPYMNILFPQAGNPYLIDKVYLGYSLDILEYRTIDAQSRTHHLPKGHMWAAQLDFRNVST